MSEADQIQNLPIGAIVCKNKKVWKVAKPYEAGGPKSVKQIGDFSITVIAKGSKKYLIDLNGNLKVDTLDFTSGLSRFKNYIRPHYFKGNEEDLETIVDVACTPIKKQKKDNLICINNYVGQYNSEDITFWIYADRILITHKKGEKLANIEQIVFTQETVLKIDNIWISIDQSGINKTLIPKFKDPGDYTLSDFFEHFTNQIKNKRLIYSFLGWNIASLYIDTIERLRNFSNFPFYVITAGTEVGKTALISNAIKMFGLNYVGENFANSVTLFVEVVEFAQVSHLPIWRDEYKNENYALLKQGLLRSVFTRSSNSRGTPKDDKPTKQYPVNATLLLSGEDITEDPALARRMIKMRLDKKDKVTKLEHEANTRIANEHFAKAFPLLLSRGFNESIFLEIYNNLSIPGDSEYKDELMCYAVIGAVFGKEKAITAIAEAIKAQKETEKDIINDKHNTAEEFFSTLDSIFLEKGWYDSLYNNTKPKVLDYFSFVNNGETVYFKFKALHNIVQKNKARDTYSWSIRALGQLITEAYSAKNEPRKIDNLSQRVFIVNNIQQFSDSFSQLCEKIQSIEAKWLHLNPPNGLNTDDTEPF